MSMTFRPVAGTTTTYTYYEAEGEPDAVNGCVRFANDEPSCNAHNSGGYAILAALQRSTEDCVGTIPNSHLVAIEAVLSLSWPEELDRYRDQLLQVVRCAMYHHCDVVYS